MTPSPSLLSGTSNVKESPDTEKQQIPMRKECRSLRRDKSVPFETLRYAPNRDQEMCGIELIGLARKFVVANEDGAVTACQIKRAADCSAARRHSQYYRLSL